MSTPSIRKLGTVLPNLTCFPSTVETMPDDGWRIFYSEVTARPEGAPLFRIGFAEGRLGEMRRHDFATQPEHATGDAMVIGNLPDGWRPVQPIHLLLDGVHRLYFWAHCPEQGIVRFLAAESANGQTYNVIDPGRPCLYHFCDRATPVHNPALKGLTWNTHAAERPPEEPEADPGLICNDATTLYQLRDGSFEMYSVALKPAPKGTPAYIPWDNCAGYRRYIRRWTSGDGLTWRPDGVAIDFDEEDPPYIQFYYLSVRQREDGSRAGILGRYNVLEQTLGLERCESPDGRHWLRKHRQTPLVPRGTLELSLEAACQPAVLRNGEAYIFYGCSNSTHGSQYCTGDRPECSIQCAVMPADGWR